MQTLQPGQAFPEVSVPTLSGKNILIDNISAPNDWKLVIVYRGKHCPLCTKYLIELNELLPKFNALGVDVIALSSDARERAEIQLAEVKPNFEVGYDLSVEQMTTLGLFISEPRLGSDAVVPFAEPALFVINEQGNLQMIDISNVPFARPNLNSMIMGINFIRSRAEKLPINGTYV